MKQSNVKEILSITVKLLVICSIVAFIVASVNFITKDKIALNQRISTAEALTDIFKDDFNGHSFTVDESSDKYIIYDDSNTVIAQCITAQCDMNENVSALYVIENENGDELFYGVAIAPMGFKAEINMLVAVNPDLTVKGVKIISMSETSGIGTKAADNGFLSKFVGKNEVSSKEVDIISGATKTSKPVINAVSEACNQVALYQSQKEVPVNE